MDSSTFDKVEEAANKSLNSNNENKPPDQMDDNNQSGDSSTVQKEKGNLNDDNAVNLSANDSHSSQNLSTNENNFDPQPSTSSKKTEMEKLLEGLGTNLNKEESAVKDFSGVNNKSNDFNWTGATNFGASSFPYSSGPQKSYENSEEYFSELRQWLQQAYFWQSVTAAFPYFMMCQQFGQMSIQPSSPLSQSIPSSVVPNFPFPFPQFPTPGVSRQDQQNTRPQVVDGVECRMPSFWKRIAAEFIDFLILFFVKIAVTYFAVDYLNLVEMDTYDIFQKDVKLAYKSFIQITQDIVILEIIHRLVVCVFETFWLMGGQNGRIGGSTPGKHILGLRVLTCETSTLVREGDNKIIVKPGTNLGLGTSFLRALTKNFVLALLIPTSFAFIFFPHNRTGYDMICNTIVVEEPVIPHHVHQD